MSDHRVGQPGQPRTVRIDNRDGEIAGFIGGQGIAGARFGDGKGLAVDFALTIHRLVFEGPVGLFHQGGEVLDLHALEGQAGKGQWVEGGGNGDPVHPAVAAGMDECQVAVALEPNQVGRGRNQGSIPGRHAAATGGVESFGKKIQPVGSFPKPVQRDIDAYPAVGVGDRRCQGFVKPQGLSTGVRERIGKVVVREFLEPEMGRLHADAHLYPAVPGRGAEQVLQFNPGGEGFCRGPTAGRCADQGAGDLHGVGHEFLHREAG
jgi:hypothetical protein